MDDGDGHAREVENAIAGLYTGPIADFVARRDALAKHLRSEGDRESATAVKALRKPSRLAWALNLGVQNDQSSFAALEAAIAGTLEAQAAGGDVRAAMAELRVAVRNLASGSADAAERAGHRVDASALSSAVLAVVGRPESFEQLRSRQLEDVPEAGGLDFMASLPAPTHAAPVTPSKPKSVPEQGRADDDVAQDNARRAAEALSLALGRAQVAEQELRDADSQAVAAEERVRMAESDLAEARKRRDRARRAAEATAAELRSATAANAEAHRRLTDGSMRSQ